VKKSNLIISTDLDGTLLDHHSYSTLPALPALQRCQSLGIPVIFNTSKTQQEVSQLQQQLNNRHPIIVENGSAITIPTHYFSSSFKHPSKTTPYETKLFGVSRDDILKRLTHINEHHHFRYTGFSQWNNQQIIEHTQLDPESALLASQRDYSEPIVWHDSEQNLRYFTEQLQSHDLTLLKGGRFYHVLGKTNKSLPLLWLKQQYQQEWQTAVTLISLGDGANDINMLEASDVAVVIKSPVNRAPVLSNHCGAQIHHSSQTGPEGWNQQVNQLIDQYYKVI